MRSRPDGIDRKKKEIPVMVRERLECPGRLDFEPNNLISRLNDLQ